MKTINHAETPGGRTRRLRLATLAAAHRNKPIPVFRDVPPERCPMTDHSAARVLAAIKLAEAARAQAFDEAAAIVRREAPHLADKILALKLAPPARRTAA